MQVKPPLSISLHHSDPCLVPSTLYPTIQVLRGNRRSESKQPGSRLLFIFRHCPHYIPVATNHTDNNDHRELPPHSKVTIDNFPNSTRHGIEIVISHHNFTMATSEKPSKEKKDTSKVHKLSLKGSAKLVAEFVRFARSVSCLVLLRLQFRTR